MSKAHEQTFHRKRNIHGQIKNKWILEIQIRMTLLYHKGKNGPAHMEGNLTLPAKITGSVVLGPSSPMSGHLSYNYRCTRGKWECTRLLIVLVGPKLTILYIINVQKCWGHFLHWDREKFSLTCQATKTTWRPVCHVYSILCNKMRKVGKNMFCFYLFA